MTKVFCEDCCHYYSDSEYGGMHKCRVRDQIGRTADTPFLLGYVYKFSLSPQARNANNDCSAYKTKAPSWWDRLIRAISGPA